VNPRESDHLESLVVDGTVIIKPIFKKESGRAWTGFIWFRI
jgi:hypothetical protein